MAEPTYAYNSNGQIVQFTDSDGKRYAKALSPSGEETFYRISDDGEIQYTPQKGVHYVYGFVPGKKYLDIDIGESTRIGEYPELWNDAIWDNFWNITNLKNTVPDVELNTKATIPTINVIASEDPTIQKQLSNAAVNDINKEAADEQVRKGLSGKEYAKLAALLGAGAVASYGGAAALPWLWSTFGPEALGALNLYGAHEGLFGDSGLLTENGINKTYNLYKQGDYEGALWSGLGDSVNLVGTLPFLSAFNTDNYIKAFYPTYTKIYHGSPDLFNLKNARTASYKGSGLHVSPRREIAESFAGENGHIMTGYIPSANTESIDTWGNGIESLGKYTPPTSGRWAAGDNSFLESILQSQGVPYKYRSNGVWNDYLHDFERVMDLEKEANIDLLKISYPNIPESEYLYLETLNNRMKEIKSARRSLSKGSEEYNRLTEEATAINQIANDILKKYGYNVIKYNNTAPFEGGGGTSYLVTDPSVIKTPFQFHWNVPSWFSILPNYSELDD